MAEVLSSASSHGRVRVGSSTRTAAMMAAASHPVSLVIGPGQVVSWGRGVGQLDPQLRPERSREVHVERLLHGHGRDREAAGEGAPLAEVVEHPAIRAPNDPRVLARDYRVGDDDGVVRAAADADRLAWCERERLVSERDLELAHSPASLRDPPRTLCTGQRGLRLPTPGRWSVTIRERRARQNATSTRRRGLPPGRLRDRRVHLGLPRGELGLVLLLVYPLG